MAANKSSGNRTLYFHLFCLLTSIIGCIYDIFYLKLNSFQTYGGRFKFLTHCSLYLHAAFYAFATGVNIYVFIRGLIDGRAQPRKGFGMEKSRKEAGFFVRLRNHLFVVVCFPLGMMVCLLFWGVTVFVPDGLAEPEERKMVPLAGLFNHHLHTFPLIFDMAALYIIPHHYPRRLVGVSSVVLISLAYLTWLVHVGNHTGVWVYPFLQHQTRFQFTVFVSCSVVAVVLVYAMGEKISSLVWKKETAKTF